MEAASWVHAIFVCAYQKAATRFAGKALGRPKTVQTDDDRRQRQTRRHEYRQRIPIEGKFGQGKGGYGLGYIRARRADTSVAWIHSIFLVMNLKILLKLFIFFVLRWPRWVIKEGPVFGLSLIDGHPSRQILPARLIWAG